MYILSGEMASGEIVPAFNFCSSVRTFCLLDVGGGVGVVWGRCTCIGEVWELYRGGVGVI